MKLLFLLPLVFAGCATVPRTLWELPIAPEPVVCDHFHEDECGLMLEGCGPERSQTFACITSAVYAGAETPGGAVERLEKKDEVQ